ncbi:hypothetical protein GIB67_037335 [Kingdonia uniflora]|uniref:Uncharacterized protein n=1 Tax=Kingdonia uniflora TaxID=39325 RepID=A0A7J7LFQ7_9MAGN|nr:hypothetical protein GIB67_037335 [Kingdonia uniflora]
MEAPSVNYESFSSDCLSYSTDSFYLSEPKPYAPRDVLLWGEGIEGGKLWGGVDIMGTPKDALSPVLLDSTVLLDIQNISFGGNHAALVTKQGGIFCWGEENGGRLGHRINMDVSYPKVIESLSGVYVESVACGQYHTCALTRSGELYTWGDIDKCHWLPRRVSGLLDSIHISMVACGEWHTAVLSSCGELYTYGDGTFGVLGHGNLENVSQPKEVESLRGLRVRFVACGSWHMAAIVDILVNHSKGKSSGGKLFTWGDGDKGKLGTWIEKESFFQHVLDDL